MRRQKNGNVRHLGLVLFWSAAAGSEQVFSINNFILNSHTVAYSDEEEENIAKRCKKGSTRNLLPCIYLQWFGWNSNKHNSVMPPQRADGSGVTWPAMTQSRKRPRRKEGKMDRLPERLAEKLGHQRVRGSTNNKNDTQRHWPGSLCKCFTISLSSASFFFMWFSERRGL